VTVLGAVGAWTALAGLAAMLSALAAALLPMLRLRKRLDRMAKASVVARLSALGVQIAEHAALIGPRVEALQRNVVRLERAVADALLALSALLFAVKQSADLVEAALDRAVPFLRGSFRRSRPM
jgi:hypothetical protein